jgi:predicted nucleotidyltransferase
MTQTVKQVNRRLPKIKRLDALTQQAQERPAVSDALLAGITKQIVEKCDPEKVILFGSYAYGNPHNDSDIDLFVIMKPTGAEETTHQRIMNVRAAAKIPLLPMDVIVRTPQEVEARLAIGDFFIKEILDRGKVLFQRDVNR